MLMEQAALETGLSHNKSVLVTEANAASAAGSGYLPVFSTPALITLMEMTAAACVQPYLPKGCSTVGTHIDVRHLAATPLGMEVRCLAELMEIDRRRLVFSCKAYDGVELVGEGVQERFIVDNEKFMKKVQLKRG